MQSFWSRSRRRFRALRRMSWSDRALAVESLAMLAAARILVKVTPQQRLVSRIGGSRITTAEVPDGASSKLSGVSGSAVSKSVGSRVGASVEQRSALHLVAQHVSRKSPCRQMDAASPGNRQHHVRRDGKEGFGIYRPRMAGGRRANSDRRGKRLLCAACRIPRTLRPPCCGPGCSDRGGTDLKSA